MRLADGTQVRARWDERQISRDRLSSVQYLKFPVGGRTPIAFGVDFAGELVAETPLTADQRAAIAADWG